MFLSLFDPVVAQEVTSFKYPIPQATKEYRLQLCKGKHSRYILAPADKQNNDFFHQTKAKENQNGPPVIMGQYFARKTQYSRP